MVYVGRASFESVKKPDEHEGTPTHFIANPTMTKKRIITTVVLTSIVIAALSFVSSHSNSQPSKEIAQESIIVSSHSNPQPSKEIAQEPITNLSEIRDCTLDECFMAGCDHVTAPYVCEWHNGGPHGGCSSIPWVEGTCEDQCNLGECDKHVIPADAPSCEGIQCPEEWCTSPQICGISAPYQCLEGSARIGCADDRFAWTLKSNDVVCSECCDARSC